MPSAPQRVLVIRLSAIGDVVNTLPAVTLLRRALPDAVLGWLREGKLSAGHARALITTENPTGLAREVIARGLSVRETERLAQAPKAAKGASAQRRPAEKDADTRVLEQDLSANLGMRVVIDHKGLDGGQLVIAYKTLEQLDELCQLLSQVR
mgnify:CR=1 FL=1